MDRQVTDEVYVKLESRKYEHLGNRLYEKGNYRWTEGYNIVNTETNKGNTPKEIPEITFNVKIISDGVKNINL